MKHLFTPWRMSFIKKNKTKKPACIFCDIIEQAQNKDEENLVLHRGKTCFVILNKYPYTCGHTMVIPYQHGSDYLALSADCHQEIQTLTHKSLKILQDSSLIDGCNIGLNIGKAGGAGIPEHLHQHLVPRWFGDSNFMPIIGNTRILPETVEQTYERLRPFY